LIDKKASYTIFEGIVKQIKKWLSSEIWQGISGIAAVIGIIIALIGLVIVLNPPKAPASIQTATLISPTTDFLTTNTGTPTPTPTLTLTYTLTPTSTSTETSTPTYTLIPTTTATLTETSTHTPPPTLKPLTPTFTPTEVPLSPTSPIQTLSTQGYPCKGQIISSDVASLNVIRPRPSSNQVVAAVEPKSSVTILAKEQEEFRVWYKINNREGKYLGWISAEYISLSQNCPS
jgi:hypothetical protein